MSTSDPTVLIIGGTGTTASRLVQKLAQRDLSVRTAARHNADVHFDWTDPTTYGSALDGADRLYLMTPVLDKSQLANLVGIFLDQTAAAGVQHVTLLSAYGMEAAPPEVGPRAIELDLLSRNQFTHSIVRPAWFMQNFSEGHLVPRDGFITVRTGDGTEAFVDVEDIAAVAAATLADPAAHAGAAYAPTGPEAMTVADAAHIIATATGLPIKHADIDRQAWIDANIAAGLPADYSGMLAMLTETIATGHGSQPNNDVERVTGTPATTFTDFARCTASQWVGAISEPTEHQRLSRALIRSFGSSKKALPAWSTVITSSTCWQKTWSSTSLSWFRTTPHVVGRANLIELHRGYGAMFVLDRCYDLRVQHSPSTSSVVLEYSSEGKVVPTGQPYGNRYISVVIIKDRRVTEWRDYLDPLRVFAALEGRPFEVDAGEVP